MRSAQEKHADESGTTDRGSARSGGKLNGSDDGLGDSRGGVFHNAATQAEEVFGAYFVAGGALTAGAVTIFEEMAIAHGSGLLVRRFFSAPKLTFVSSGTLFSFLTYRSQTHCQLCGSEGIFHAPHLGSWEQRQYRMKKRGNQPVRFESIAVGRSNPAQPTRATCSIADTSMPFL
jgi:hypothetical protein